MNDITPPSASSLGMNPYDYAGKTMTAVNGPSSPYDARAKGLDGDLLDANMKARWQEGFDTGRVEGQQVAASRYGVIYDEAFAAGAQLGSSRAIASIAAEVVPVLQQVGNTLVQVQGKTGSQAVKDLCGAQIEALQAVLEAQVGRVADAQTAATAGAPRNPSIQ